MPRISKQDQQEAIQRLHEWVKPGDTVFCVLRHESSSGMSRVIQFFTVKDDEPRYLGFNIALACGYAYDRKREGVKVQGCGMDMGFAVVYHLGRVLFPEGGSLELSPRESQERRAGETRETDGGYLLKHRWL